MTFALPNNSLSSIPRQGAEAVPLGFQVNVYVVNPSRLSITWLISLVKLLLEKITKCGEGREGKEHN